MTNYFHMEMAAGDIGAISNLGLAHIGDAVYELMVRVWLCKNGKATAHGLHKSAVKHVSAPAQAAAAKRLLPHLTESEQSAYKRGRNTRVGSVPKNATLEQYHAATGLETLFGYLYLKGEIERLNELFQFIMEGGPPHAS
ncbi:MAG: ribonuclease III [Oscillospiraceae bacterium]|nr:ribonuclease III [Oscillospiraceae bacterium]